MHDTDTWLADYGEDHRDIDFAVIYWVSVIVLVCGTVGLLWILPVPTEFQQISPLLNWGTTFLMAAMVYYFIISMSLAIGMLPFVFGIAALQIRIQQSPWPHTYVAAILFAASLVGIYLGRSSTGSMKTTVRAILRDIQMMMIAPVWMLSILYRRFGIPF